MFCQIQGCQKYAVKLTLCTLTFFSIFELPIIFSYQGIPSKKKTHKKQVVVVSQMAREGGLRLFGMDQQKLPLFLFFLRRPQVW